MTPLLLEIVRQKRRPLIGLLLLLLVTVALFIVADGYQAPKIAEEQTQWSELRRKAARAGRTDFTTTYRRNGAELETLRERIPPRNQFPRLLGEIMEQAAASGVTIGQILYKPRPIAEEKLLVYGVTMAVSARYAPLKSFLADLLNSREMVVVEDFSLTSRDPMVDMVAMELHLTVYLREGR